MIKCDNIYHATMIKEVPKTSEEFGKKKKD